MAALRLMTFNVQCLPMIAGALDGTISLPGLVLGLVPGSDSDAIDRAQSIVDALVALAADERPHVIALNEVFHEDARRTFLDGLSGDWPYVVESVHEGDLEEDSGLMVFSSLAFLNLGGTDRRELFYRDDAGADVWASKAAVLVQVGVPELTTLVFTHLQAAYDTDSQYRDVRAAQLAEIVDGLLRPELGDYPEAWSDVIVAGDLNIRGDADAEGDEWETTFATPDGEFGSIFVDSWVEMRPPGVDADLDPGLTHRDRASQVGQRLDYITHLRRTDGPRLLPHAMRIGHRSLSDHVALEAVLQHETRHCQPSSALELDAMTVIAGGAPAQPVGSVARYAHVDLTRDDERFWVWMPRVGTYTFFAGTDLAYDVYAATDISHPLERLADLVAGEVPPYLENAVLEFRGSIDPVGGTFVHREQMLVAIRSRTGGRVQQPFVVFEHRGDSQATAIGLPPHHDVEVPYPVDEMLGDNDECWFRIQPRDTLAGGDRTEIVTLRHAGWDASDLRLLDRGTGEIASTSGTGELGVDATVSEAETLYALVRRHGSAQVGQVIRWHTPVSYLRLDRGVFIHVADETGPDWPGDDEAELTLHLDGRLVTRASWREADSKEDWPRLTERVRGDLFGLGWSGTSVGVVEGAAILISDPDTIPVAHGVAPTTVPALGPGDPAEVKRVVSVRVFDAISDGTYIFTCTFTRDP